MKQTVWHRLDLAARQATPVSLTLILLLLSMLPLGVPGFAPVMPALAVIAVYYWAVHRPDLLPIWAVFGIGLFSDLLRGEGLGVGVLLVLLVYGIVVSQRRFFVSRSFLVIWFGFTLVALASSSLMWALHSLLASQFLDPRPAIFQYLTTVAAYPLLAWFFARAQRALLR
ncbi:MAG: rod shape-determining protein MreD [Rhodovibrionaceae bacterium]|nr:rod shape-determining protein MreD [Rhodovibrionaceae bacterium]